MPELTRLRARVLELEEVVSTRGADEGALAASELRFRRLFEAAKDGILIVDAESGVVDAINPFLESLLGYSTGELLGRALWELGPFRDRFNSEQAFRHLQSHEYIRYEDLPLVSKDGQSVSVEFVSNVYSVGEKRVIQCNVRDISERKKAEAIQARLTEVLEATPDLVGIADLSGEVIYLNRAGRRMVGMSDADDPTSHNIRDFLTDVGRRLTFTVGRPTALRDGHWTGETEMMALDGHAIPVSQTISAHRGRDGTVEFTSTIARDISQRRQVEKSLRLQSAALNASSNAIIITDRAGAIQWVNPAFVKLSGYGAEETLGRNPRDLSQSGRHDRSFYERLWQTILAGLTWSGEITNRRKDGSHYTVDATITPILDEVGTVTHFVAIHQDITARLALEGQFRQAQRMESVGRVAGGVAHDFNNLLAVISGNAELMAEDVPGNHRSREELDEILKATERAAALTRQLLAFSRQQVLEPKILDLSDLVRGMEKMLQRLIGEDVQVESRLDFHGARVRADPGQLEQVIMNLVVNARDALSTGGTITIETSQVVLDDEYVALHADATPGANVLLAVSDTGVGIAPEIQSRIFEPFFTTKEAGRGTGLGLSTVYGIIRQSGGHVGVYSEPGQGATFKVYLPLVTSEVYTAEDSRPQVASSGGRETILVVEDDASVRRVTVAMLERKGYLVLEAGNGRQALSLIKGTVKGIDLLITDVVMPEMGGPELGHQLASIWPGLKILYVSGYTDSTIARHGLSEGEVFLQKPFSSETIAHKVRSILDSGKTLRRE